MKKWIAYMLSALCLMPVGQLCAGDNIFITETVGRQTFISLNTQLQVKPFYEVTLRVPDFAESVNGVRPAKEATISFPWTQHANDYRGRMYRHDATRGYTYPATVRWFGGAATVQMTAGLGPEGIEQEKVWAPTNPRMIVETKRAGREFYFRSALEVTDTSFREYDTKRMVSSRTVFAENIFRKTFYGFGLEDGKAGIYTCPINTKTGLFSVTSDCSFLDIDEEIRSLIVSPSFDALWALTDSGEALVFRIMPDGSISNDYWRRGRFPDAESVDEIALTATPEIGFLASSVTGKVYQFRWEDLYDLYMDALVDVTPREVVIESSSALVGMLTPQFEDETHFVTAVGNTMIGCYNTSSSMAMYDSFRCDDIMTLDQPITSITPAISHGVNYSVLRMLLQSNRYRERSRMEFRDSWVVGLLRRSDTYDTNVLTCSGTHRGEAFLSTDCEPAIATTRDAKQRLEEVVAIALY